MSIDTTTPDNPSTTEHDDERPDGDNRSATLRTATAADHLWAALHARPDATAVRVPTDGKRSASRYAIPVTGDGAPADGTDDASTVTSDPDAPPVAQLHDIAPATDDATDADGDPGGGADEEGTTTRPPGASPAAGDVEANTPNTTDPAPEVDAEANTPADDADDGGDSTEGTAGARAVTPGRGTRLAPGALHGMVEDYLRDHPGGEFGPTKIGHDLARSTGAVGNALERLVASGYAIRTKDRPKRYALAPTGSTGDDPEPVGNRDA